MPNKPESLLLNNFEVNRIFNLKKSNRDRVHKFQTGNVDPGDYGSNQGSKKIKHQKN